MSSTSDGNRTGATHDDSARKALGLARWKREWVLWGVGTVVLAVVWAVIYLVRGKLVLWSLPVSIIIVWFLLVALAPLVPARRPAQEKSPS